jgi:hypothetical protein
MLSALKSELEKKVGFALDSFKNCRRLENLLQQKSIYISYSSIARIFSVGNKTTQPRLSTLNELSGFLDYNSYDHFKHFFEYSSEELEEYTCKVLEMKSELFFGNRLKGLELFISIRKKFGTLSNLLSQDIALHLFNQPNLPQNELQHLVAQGISEVNFMEFFVYEDDPFGHYGWFLEHASKSDKQTRNFNNFKELYIERKRLLNGNFSDNKRINKLGINESVHLYSRILEVEILQIAANRPKRLLEYFQDQLGKTVLLLKDRQAYDKIIVLGRLFRAACYTDIIEHVIIDEETKRFCIEVINSNAIELEFMAPMYVVLKNDPTLKLSLAFFHNNYWKNAQFESEMLIGKALGLKNIYNTYQKGLLVKQM